MLYRVGGVWDSLAQEYTGEPTEAHVVTLEEGERATGIAIARYLRAKTLGVRKRIRALLMYGNRGGGKTWMLGLLFVTFALAFPGTWQMCVNITKSQKLEVIDGIREIGARWVQYEEDSQADPKLVFITQTTLLWRSAGNPAAMRMAKLVFELIAINEAQDQPSRVWSNAVGAIRNTGGLVAVATNPPQVDRSSWVYRVCRSILAGTLPAEAYELRAADNSKIDQDAQPDLRALLAAGDPRAAAADADGLMRPPGDLAYPEFQDLPLDKGGNIGEPPRVQVGRQLWTDVTREVTAKLTGVSDGYPVVIGADFQGDPGCCATPGKLFRDEQGQLVLWIAELIVAAGVEEDLSAALVAAGYYPGPVDEDGRPATSALIVGDATGHRQNARHDKEQPYSFTRLRAHGWNVIGPTRHWRTGIPWWAPVAASRKQVRFELAAQRIVLAPRCRDEVGHGFPSLVDAFTGCKWRDTGAFERKGHNTHGPDCVRNLAWRFLDRPLVVPAAGVDRRRVEAMDRVADILKGRS